MVLLTREADDALDGLPSNAFLRCAVERRDTNDKLKDHASDTPPVDLLTVAPLLPDLRGDVFSRASESGGQILWVDLLGQTIVYDGDVALLIEKRVL